MARFLCCPDISVHINKALQRTDHVVLVHSGDFFENFGVDCSEHKPDVLVVAWKQDVTANQTLVAGIKRHFPNIAVVFTCEDTVTYGEVEARTFSVVLRTPRKSSKYWSSDDTETWTRFIPEKKRARRFSFGWQLARQEAA